MQKALVCIGRLGEGWNLAGGFFFFFLTRLTLDTQRGNWAGFQTLIGNIPLQRSQIP